MAPNDNPPTESEPCPLGRGDAEFAKALEMPETGARHQQLDRAAAFFAEADAAKTGDIAIRLRRVATAFLASGKSSERIGAARASAKELGDGAGDSPDDFHARAVAASVVGDFDAAWAAYQALADHPGADTAQLAKARHLARHMARSAGLAMDRFDGAFPPLRLIVFSGHLPPRVDESCRALIAAELEALGAGIGVASAAAGADLLFLECLHARGGEFHLILPWSSDSFRETSIRSFGGEPGWETKFDEALAGAASVREIGEFAGPDSPVAWQYLLEVSAGIAMRIARERHLDIVPLAVWDGKPGYPGGTAAFCDFWKGQMGIEPKVITPPAASSGVAAPSTARRSLRRAQSEILQQSVKSMLFVDVVGFSSLPESVMPRFIEHFLNRVSGVIAESSHAPHTVNTWGDALYAVFDFVEDAGRFALELNEMVEGSAAEWQELGLGKLRIRTGLHAGPVFLHQDPIVRRLGFSGAHVNRAARIEPVAEPGGILASEEFAALATITPGIGFSVEYARSGKLYKNYPGTHRLYRVIRDRSADLLLLAKAIHEDYCEKARGYGDTPETNSALLPWESLPPGLQSANLAQADDIPHKLRSLGYEIVEAGGVPATEIKLDPALVEPLSIAEHDRWMAEKLRAGWTYAPVRDNSKLHHPLLVNYDDLPEREKEKDRDTVRNIPNLLAKAKCLVKAI
jgi:class 3 adenylate cyclase